MLIAFCFLILLSLNSSPFLSFSWRSSPLKEPSTTSSVISSIIVVDLCNPGILNAIAIWLHSFQDFLQLEAFISRYLAQSFEMTCGLNVVACSRLAGGSLFAIVCSSWWVRGFRCRWSWHLHLLLGRALATFHLISPPIVDWLLCAPLSSAALLRQQAQLLQSFWLQEVQLLLNLWAKCCPTFQICFTSRYRAKNYHISGYRCQSHPRHSVASLSIWTISLFSIQMLEHCLRRTCSHWLCNRHLSCSCAVNCYWGWHYASYC